MLFAKSSHRSRRAFTLVELLTVIVIIGILAGLVTAAAIRVQSSVKKAAHALELKQLDMALQAYKERLGDFPPDGLSVKKADGTTVDAEDLFKAHVRKAFPRCSTTTVNNAWSNWGQYLNPKNSLAFWLGGLYANGQFSGFSANPANPFDTSTTSRIGPFYTEFDEDRLYSEETASGSNRYVCSYHPTVEARQTPADQAIIYYRANPGNVGSEYSNGRNYAFRDGRTSGWINPRTYQIISPGLRGGKYSDWNSNPWYPSVPSSESYTYTAAQLDGMSNFMTGTLEDDMP